MKIYLVGGAVRDELLGLPVKERDYVVVGATVNDMLKLGFKQVGKEFPVFLHPQTGEEYALARAERKVGPGYKGFTFDTSKEVTLEEDLKRRDLTINAMARDLDTQQLIDPYGGQKDIKDKVLRQVSAAFAEDPVRILRVGRFLARYAYLKFSVHPETLHSMQEMVASKEVHALVAERVWKELERALSEKNPEKFFVVLDETKALPVLFPYLHYHGQGLAALIAASRMTEDSAVRFAALLHDYPEEHPENVTVKKAIADLCHRYRVPNSYHQLAVLTALHYQKALTGSSLSAEEILDLLSSLDVFRREQRFHDFLLACEAIAQGRKKTFDRQWWLKAALAAKNIDVQALIKQGFKGGELAMKLREKRRQAIEQWLSSL